MTGDKIGRYRIIRPLGSGGMAEVYLARDPVLDRDVAIKIPHPEKLDATMLARFMREATTVAQLEHPAIVPLYDVGEHDGRPYLVMRYMPGGTLADRIERRTFDLRGALGIVERIAAALDYAHRHGVLHRDVKPGNILFDEAGQAYLSDFGIARINSKPGDSLTQTGMAIGTAAYMSPEQALGQLIDGRSDIYSLGVVIFEMLAGDVPYKADSSLQQAMQHINAPIPPIRERRQDLPPKVQMPVNRALAKQPKDRYQSAESLAVDLRRAAAAAPSAAKVGTPVWVWLVGLVGVAAVAFFLFGRPGPGRPPDEQANTRAAEPMPNAIATTVRPTSTLAPLSNPVVAAAVTTTTPTVTPTPTDPPITATPTSTPTPDLASALPFFMTRLLTIDDIEGLSAWELDVMRNEIFARHGRGFNRADLQAHFDAQPWYVRRYEPANFPADRLLTDIQKQNAALILDYQERTP